MSDPIIIRLSSEHAAVITTQEIPLSSTDIDEVYLASLPETLQVTVKSYAQEHNIGYRKAFDCLHAEAVEEGIKERGQNHAP